MTASDVLDYRSARGLAADLAAGRVSAAEAVEHAIARIERFDGALGAVVARDFERARAAAFDADAALARGERRPLLGVPVTIKESIDVAGLPKTWGMPWFADWRSTSDAVVVERLKAAGAIVIGKTNVPFALGDWQSFNEIYGTTNNPWAPGVTPGGSSGGSAVSLAAGYAALEIGSDIGGSLRAPAHYCGVFSHRPSRGVVPSRGNAPPEAFGLTPDLSVVGPLARSASDLSLAFDVIAGPDVLEAAGWRMELAAPRHDRLADYRVLVLDSHPLLPASSDVRAAIGRLAERLRVAGARVETSSALVPDLVALARSFVGLLMPVVFARQPVERLAAIAQRAAELPADADTPGAWTLRGAVASHREWLAADAVRIRSAYAWHDLFQAFDVVLFPPMPTAAFPQNESIDENATLEIDGTLYPYGDQVVYAGVAAAPGLPATTVPLERTPAGLPVGVQIMGPYLGDRTTLRFAELLEDAFGGFVRPPGY
jgi:amidase